MNLNMQAISAAASSKAVFQRGVEYYNQRRVSKLKTEKDADRGNTKITADVRGGKYSYEVEISLDRDGNILESWCDCPAFYENQGCCKHIVAVLVCWYFISREKSMLRKDTIGDMSTDNYASRILGQYSKRVVCEAMAYASQKKAKLLPLLEFDYSESVSLCLSVGHDRMYIVKDLGKFYSDMLEGNTVDYGVKLKLIHEENAFEEGSKSLLRFFMNKYREYSGIASLLGATTGKTGRRELYLTPASFDEFFKLYSGHQVEIKTSLQKRFKVTFTDLNPELEIIIKEIDNQAFLFSFSKNPEMIFIGEKFLYVLLDDIFYRCDEAFTAASKDFLRALRETNGRLLVNNRDMGMFCAHVLSQIRPYFKITADESALTRYEPAELSTKLYLDMPMPGFITARLCYCYGNLEIDAMDEREFPDLQRDVRGEYIARAVVDKYIGSYDLTKRLLFIDNDDKIYNLIFYGIPEISAFAEVYTTDRLQKISVRKPPSVSVGVRLHGELLDIQMDAEDFPPDELIELLSSYRQRKKYHKLKSGAFINLENSALADISELVDGLNLKKEDIYKGEATVPKYRAMFVNHILNSSDLVKSERDTDFKAMLRDIKDTDEADIRLPEELRHVLRNYQKKGFRWLKTMSRYGFGGILADDMGLGKTLEAIAYLQSNKEESEGHCVSIVICPTSLVLNWENEIKKFAPSLKPLSIIGNAAARSELVEKIPDYDIVITSYELLKRDVGLYESYLFDCEIIDEAQYIKNYNTQNANAVKNIKSKHRFALTGTPIENSLAELWSVFDFLMPGYLYSHGKFKETFEIPIVKYEDELMLERLRQMIAPFILRRLKSSVLKELPEKTETVLYTKLEGEQDKLYRANLSRIRQELTQNGVAQQAEQGNRMVVLSMLTRLRQICCDPSLAYDNYIGESAKLELCLELLETSVDSGHKVLLFSQFTSMLSIIEQRLKKMHYDYFVLKGSTSKEERERMISRFHTDKTPIFLISLKAGGTGLNLTAADIVIHYDPWWNVSAQNQATDRAYRIGQEKKVQVYKLIAQNTIEEKILKLQNEKYKLAESVITEGGGLISQMTQQDLLRLLEE